MLIPIRSYRTGPLDVIHVVSDVCAGVRLYSPESEICFIVWTRNLVGKMGGTVCWNLSDTWTLFMWSVMSAREDSIGSLLYVSTSQWAHSMERHVESQGNCVSNYARFLYRGMWCVTDSSGQLHLTSLPHAVIGYIILQFQMNGTQWN